MQGVGQQTVDLTLDRLGGSCHCVHSAQSNAVSAMQGVGQQTIGLVLDSLLIYLAPKIMLQTAMLVASCRGWGSRPWAWCWTACW